MSRRSAWSAAAFGCAVALLGFAPAQAQERNDLLVCEVIPPNEGAPIILNLLDDPDAVCPPGYVAVEDIAPAEFEEPASPS